MAIRLGELATLLGAELHGPGELELEGIATPREAGPTQLVVAFDADAAAVADEGQAAALVVPHGVTAQRPYLAVDDPRGALSRILELLAGPPPAPEGVHPTAVVHETARLGADITVGPGAVIEAEVVTGERVRIGPCCVVGRGARLGDDVLLHANVTVYHGVRLGDRVAIHSGAVVGADGFGYRWDGTGHRKIPQLGTVVIEDDVEIGANACVDRATVGETRVGRGTKIDDLVMISHNCSIGQHCIIISQVGIAGSCDIGHGVMLAGQVGIADHIKVGDRTQVGAQSGLMRDAPPGARLFGSPALPEKEAFRIVALMQRLRELFQRLRDVEQKVEQIVGDTDT